MNGILIYSLVVGLVSVPFTRFTFVHILDGVRNNDIMTRSASAAIGIMISLVWPVVLPAILVYVVAFRKGRTK